MGIPRSKIGWTDHSGGDANFVLRGKAPGECEASPGCANCYAYALRNRDPKRAADVTTWDGDKLARLARVRLGGDGLRRGPGARPLCFVVDMGDLFHTRVPDDFIMQALGIMGDRADVDWQVLTKRPERMAAMWGDVRPFPANVWAGTTAETQATAAQRIPHLARVPASVRFVSVEPMLGPVILDLSGLGWVICGGESGPRRRRFDVAWARDLGGQCDAAGVPFFYKQGSAQYPGRDCILDGAERKAWPASVPQAAPML